MSPTVYMYNLLRPYNGDDIFDFFKNLSQVIFYVIFLKSVNNRHVSQKLEKKMYLRDGMILHTYTYIITIGKKVKTSNRFLETHVPNT